MRFRRKSRFSRGRRPRRSRFGVKRSFKKLRFSRKKGFSSRRKGSRFYKKTFKGKVIKTLYDTAAQDTYLNTTNQIMLASAGQYVFVQNSSNPPSAWSPYDTDAIATVIQSGAVTNHYMIKTAVMTCHATNTSTAPCVLNVWKFICRKNIPSYESSFNTMFLGGWVDIGLSSASYFSVGLTPYQNPRLTSYCKGYGKSFAKTIYPGQTFKYTLKQKMIKINKNTDRAEDYIYRKGTKLLIMFLHGFPQSDATTQATVCYGQASVAFSWTNKYTYSYIQDDTNIATVLRGNHSFPAGEEDMARTSIPYSYQPT